MKIFNLETKKHLVGWSVVLGVIVNSGLFFVKKTECISCPFFPGQICLMGGGFSDFCTTISGWPFSTSWTSDAFNRFTFVDYMFKSYILINLAFWIMIFLVSLSIIRRFKYKTS
jgi:hypothetical protein